MATTQVIVPDIQMAPIIEDESAALVIHQKPSLLINMADRQARPPPPPPNVRTRAMFRTGRLSDDRPAQDRTPLYAGVQRRRRSRTPAPTFAGTVVQAHPSRGPRTALPRPLTPRPPYQPLVRPVHPIAAPAQNDQGSPLHRAMAQRQVAIGIIEAMQMTLFQYNDLRTLDRAMSRILPPFSEVARVASGDGDVSNMPAAHLHVECTNKGFGPHSLSDMVQFRDMYGVLTTIVKAQPGSWEYRTWSEGTHHQCGNTVEDSPELRFYACNGRNAYYSATHATVNLQWDMPHPPIIVCEECVRGDFHAMDPMRFGIPRVMPLCRTHSEQIHQSDAVSSVTGHNLLHRLPMRWEQCTCPNNHSPFRYKNHPRWFCSWCAMGHLIRVERKWRNTIVKYMSQPISTPDRMFSSTRDYVHDVFPQGPERNGCLACEYFKQEPRTTWQDILNSYPEVDIPGQEDTMRDCERMYKLCVGCFKHVPEQDIDRYTLRAIGRPKSSLPQPLP